MKPQGQGLSKREKILIFSVALLVIVYVLIQFVVFPLATSYIASLQQRESLTHDKARLEEDLANFNIISNEYSNASQEFEAAKKDYPLLKPNEEIDTILTNLCIRNGLSPERLNMTRPSSSQSGGESDGSMFTIVTASMSVKGQYFNINRILDRVDTMQYIRITNLGYAAGRPPADGSDTITPADITLGFELTFLTP